MSMQNTNPPIGKAPNDGGGDLERAKKIIKELVYWSGSEYYAPLDRLVKRVEEAEKLVSYRAEDKKAFDALRENRNEIEKERDTLKSKLSEAEKAISELLDLATVEALTGEQDARRDDVFASAGETLSRLRADGGGRGV